MATLNEIIARARQQEDPQRPKTLSEIIAEARGGAAPPTSEAEWSPLSLAGQFGANAAARLVAGGRGLANLFLPGRPADQWALTSPETQEKVRTAFGEADTTPEKIAAFGGAFAGEAVQYIGAGGLLRGGLRAGAKIAGRKGAKALARNVLKATGKATTRTGKFGQDILFGAPMDVATSQSGPQESMAYAGSQIAESFGKPELADRLRAIAENPFTRGAFEVAAGSVIPAVIHGSGAAKDQVVKRLGRVADKAPAPKSAPPTSPEPTPTPPAPPPAPEPTPRVVTPQRTDFGALATDEIRIGNMGTPTRQYPISPEQADFFARHGVNIPEPSSRIKQNDFLARVEKTLGRRMSREEAAFAREVWKESGGTDPAAIDLVAGTIHFQSGPTLFTRPAPPLPPVRPAPKVETPAPKQVEAPAVPASTAPTKALGSVGSRTKPINLGGRLLYRQKNGKWKVQIDGEWQRIDDAETNSQLDQLFSSGEGQAPAAAAPTPPPAPAPTAAVEAPPPAAAAAPAPRRGRRARQQSAPQDPTAAVWERLRSGDQNVKPDPTDPLSVAVEVRKRGGLNTKEDFDRFVADWVQNTPKNAQEANALVQRHRPAEAQPTPEARGKRQPKAPTKKKLGAVGSKKKPIRLGPHTLYRQRNGKWRLKTQGGWQRVDDDALNTQLDQAYRTVGSAPAIAEDAVRPTVAREPAPVERVNDPESRLPSIIPENVRSRPAPKPEAAPVAQAVEGGVGGRTDFYVDGTGRKLYRQKNGKWRVKAQGEKQWKTVYNPVLNETFDEMLASGEIRPSKRPAEAAAPAPAPEPVPEAPRAEAPSFPIRGSIRFREYKAQIEREIGRPLVGDELRFIRDFHKHSGDASDVPVIIETIKQMEAEGPRVDVERPSQAPQRAAPPPEPVAPRPEEPEPPPPPTTPELDFRNLPNYLRGGERRSGPRLGNWIVEAQRAIGRELTDDERFFIENAFNRGDSDPSDLQMAIDFIKSESGIGDVPTGPIARGDRVESQLGFGTVVKLEGNRATVRLDNGPIGRVDVGSLRKAPPKGDAPNRRGGFAERQLVEQAGAATIGASVGAASDEENRARGAIVGGLAGMGALNLARGAGRGFRQIGDEAAEGAARSISSQVMDHVSGAIDAEDANILQQHLDAIRGLYEAADENEKFAIRTMLDRTIKGVDENTPASLGLNGLVDDLLDEAIDGGIATPGGDIKDYITRLDELKADRDQELDDIVGKFLTGRASDIMVEYDLADELGKADIVSKLWEAADKHATDNPQLARDLEELGNRLNNGRLDEGIEGLSETGEVPRGWENPAQESIEGFVDPQLVDDFTDWIMDEMIGGETGRILDMWMRSSPADRNALTRAIEKSMQLFRASGDDLRAGDMQEALDEIRRVSQKDQSQLPMGSSPEGPTRRQHLQSLVQESGGRLDEVPGEEGLARTQPPHEIIREAGGNADPFREQVDYIDAINSSTLEGRVSSENYRRILRSFVLSDDQGKRTMIEQIRNRADGPIVKDNPVLRSRFLRIADVLEKNGDRLGFVDGSLLDALFPGGKKQAAIEMALAATFGHAGMTEEDESRAIGWLAIAGLFGMGAIHRSALGRAWANNGGGKLLWDKMVMGTRSNLADKVWQSNPKLGQFFFTGHNLEENYKQLKEAMRRTQAEGKMLAHELIRTIEDLEVVATDVDKVMSRLVDEGIQGDDLLGALKNAGMDDESAQKAAQTIMDLHSLMAGLGQNLVRLEVLKPGQVAKYRNKYLRRIYAEFLGEGDESVRRSGKKVRISDESLGRTKSRRARPHPDLTPIESAKLRGATSIIEEMDLIAHETLFRAIRENDGWVDAGYREVADKIKVNQEASRQARRIRNEIIWKGNRPKRLHAERLRKQIERLTPAEKRRLQEVDAEIARLRDERRELGFGLARAGKEAEEKGFVKISKGKNPKLGSIDGLYVRPDVKADLDGITALERRLGTAADFYDKWFRAWKAGKTILNPSTHMRNIWGAQILGYLGDGPEPFGKYNRESWKIIREAGESGNKRHDDFYRLARKHGIFDTSFGKNVVMDVRRTQDDVLKRTIREVGASPETGVRATARKAFQRAADTYQREDVAARLAYFIDAIERRGMSPEAAAKEAKRWIPDYQNLSEATQVWGRVVPFFAYTASALPRIVESASKFPLRFLQIGVMSFALENLFFRDPVPEQVLPPEMRGPLSDAPVPEWMKQIAKFVAPTNIPVPGATGKTGERTYLDLTYILPYGDIAEGRGRGYGFLDPIPQQFNPASNPAIKYLASLGLNRDPFTRRDLVSQSMTAGEKARTIFDYTYKQATPPLAPAIPGLTGGGWSWEKLRRAGLVPRMENGEVTFEPIPNWYDEVKTPGRTVGDVFFGLKNRDIVASREFDRRRKEIMAEMEDLGARTREVIGNPGISRLQKQRTIADYRDRLDHLREELKSFNRIRRQVPGTR